MTIVVAWRRTMAGAKLRAAPVTRDLKARAREYVRPGGVRIVEFTQPRILLEQVAFWHEVTVADLRGPERRFHAARFDAIAAVYVNCRIDGRRLSLHEIGRHFGFRDHTTILNALRRRGLTPQRRGAGVSSASP